MLLLFFRFWVTEQVFLPGGGDVERRLCQRELYWIHAAGSLQPPGLNGGFHMSVVLYVIVCKHGLDFCLGGTTVPLSHGLLLY